MAITPRPTFNIFRPDEVAECWDGVSDDLYKALWACVPDYKAPSPEVSEEPCIGMDCIADFWDRFTPEQQQELNLLDQDKADEWEAGWDDGQPDEAQEWHDFDPDC